MSINRNRNGRLFKRSQGACARCGRHGELRARRLDATCYQASRLDGTLVDYPRAKRQFTDLVEDYEFLRARGEADEQIARRLGYADSESLRTTLWQARRAVTA